MRKILILGGTGFIGRNLVIDFSVKKNTQVFSTHFSRKAPDIPNVTWIKTDLTKKHNVENLFSQQFDVVIQAAAVTSGISDVVNRPHIHVSDNAVMNSFIFPAVWASNVEHFIFFSCSIMYADREWAQSEEEFDPNLNLKPKYFGAGWTKIYLEKMAEFYSSLGKTKFTVVRHSNVFGPFDKFDLERSHLVGATITKVMFQQKVGSILVWGDGKEKRDLLYVEDLVQFVHLCISHQLSNFEVFNAGGPSFLTVREIVELIISKSGKDIKIQFDHDKPTVKSNVKLDCRKAKKLIGWEPKFTLEEGLSKTLNWWQLNSLMLSGK